MPPLCASVSRERRERFWQRNDWQGNGSSHDGLEPRIPLPQIPLPDPFVERLIFEQEVAEAAEKVRNELISACVSPAEILAEE